MLRNFWIDLSAWWAGVSPEFAFLLALPFAVAAIGLAGDAWRRRRERPRSRGRDRCAG